ncbi:Muscle protein 20, partial [Operophtera brumata]
ELEAKAWIEAVIGERFPSDLPFELALRDGIILCKLMNRLQPGIITKTTDLWDQKNIALVTSTIFAIGRTVKWRGPSLGPKPAEENRREFSEDVLRAGEGVIGLQAGTNNFATQSGQSFGASRKIILGK